MTKRVAVIGAGLAGLACARVLRRAGFFVEVFEQDRIIGGRMATTRIGTTSFDHGCQYLTARSAVFRNYLEELAAGGYAGRWMPRAIPGQEGCGQLSPWYVGTPGMSAVVRPLAESVQIHVNCRVHTIEPEDRRRWTIWLDDRSTVGPFAGVAIAVPAPEAALLVGRLEALAEPLTRVRIQPCWALMVRLEDRLLPEQDVYSDMSEVIRWVARNNTKPGRGARGEAILVHASPAWSREVEDADPDQVADELWNETSHVLGLPPVRPALMAAHLWRHAIVDQALAESYIFSSEHNVGIAGDWCLGRLAEHAFESGQSLGRAMVGALD